MPLIKHNKTNQRESGANEFPRDVQSANVVENPGQMNMPQSQLPQAGLNTQVENHHYGLNPATRPFGVHDSAALNAPGATTNVDGATIPAAGAAKKSSAGASEKAFVGKLEHAAGTILCSSTLRAKGIQKEKEAQALKVQAAELNAAERLEQEARLRRERAVAHGADPQILQQGPRADMNTATDSGVPNLAGVGAGPTSGHPTGDLGTGGVPQNNLNTEHIPQTQMAGAGIAPGGGANQGMAGQQTATTTGMAPQGMMSSQIPVSAAVPAQQTTGTTPHAAHMLPQGTQPGMENQQALQGQGQLGNYPPQRQDIIGQSAYPN